MLELTVHNSIVLKEVSGIIGGKKPNEQFSQLTNISLAPQTTDLGVITFLMKPSKVLVCKPKIQNELTLRLITWRSTSRLRTKH